MHSLLTCVSVGLILIAAMLTAPAKGAEVRPPSDDPWLLVSYDPDQPFGTFVGNGLISTQIKGDGVGSQDGNPLACFMMGCYGENIVHLPSWSDLRFYCGAMQFKIDKSADYKQTFDMKKAILATYATWRADDKTLKGHIEVIVSRSRPNVALVRAEFTPDFTGTISARLHDFSVSKSLKMSGEDTIRDFPAKGLHTAVSRFVDEAQKQRLLLTHAIVPSEAQTLGIQVKRGRKLTISSWTAVSDRESKPINEDFASSVNDPAAFISDHKAAWAKLWQKDIVIDGCPRDQQIVHSCMFYLLQSVREGSQWSIPPMGLSNDGWAGHVFWDADTWMFPALLLQHPELARSIAGYRYNTLPQAIENAKAGGYAGAEYAWRSTLTGREGVAPGMLFNRQRHITGDVALAQWQYYLATGDLHWLKTRGYPVIKATADYWVSRVEPVNGRYEIRQVMPPDEDAGLVDNNVYTNAVAKLNLQIALRAAALVGDSENPDWSAVAAKIYIPYDAENKRFIACDNYDGRQAKQADTELLIYPLQYPLPQQDETEIYKNTFYFYASKMRPVGPAYSWSAHSVIKARFGERDKAYAAFQACFEPCLRGPFHYLNETANPNHFALCYVTACSGPIQAAIFGFAGAHMDYSPKDPATAELTFHPSLPAQWKSLKITGVQWHGKTFDVTVHRGNRVTIRS